MRNCLGTTVTDLYKIDVLSFLLGSDTVSAAVEVSAI